MAYAGPAFDFSNPTGSGPTSYNPNRITFSGLGSVFENGGFPRAPMTIASWWNETIPLSSSLVQRHMHFGHTHMGWGFRYQAAVAALAQTYKHSSGTRAFAYSDRSLAGGVSLPSQQWFCQVIVIDDASKTPLSWMLNGDDIAPAQTSLAGTVDTGSSDLEIGHLSLGGFTFTNDLQAIGQCAVWYRQLTLDEEMELQAGLDFRAMHSGNLAFLLHPSDVNDIKDEVTGTVGSVTGNITQFSTGPFQFNPSSGDIEDALNDLDYTVSKSEDSVWDSLLGSDGAASSAKRAAFYSDSTGTPNGAGRLLNESIVQYFNQRYGGTPSIWFGPGNGGVAPGIGSITQAATRSAGTPGTKNLPGHETITVGTAASIGDAEIISFDTDFSEFHEDIIGTTTEMDKSSLAVRLYGIFRSSGETPRIREYHGDVEGDSHDASSTDWGTLSDGDEYVSPLIALTSPIGSNSPQIAIDSASGSLEYWAVELVDTSCDKGITWIPIADGGRRVLNYVDTYDDCADQVALMDPDMAFIMLGTNSADVDVSGNAWPDIWGKGDTGLEAMAALIRSDAAAANLPIIYLPMMPFRDGHTPGDEEEHGRSVAYPYFMADSADENDYTLFINMRRKLEEDAGWITPLPDGSDNSGITDKYTDEIHWGNGDAINAWISAFSAIVDDIAQLNVRSRIDAGEIPAGEIPAADIYAGDIFVTE
jgi:hypothetical protein